MEIKNGESFAIIKEFAQLITEKISLGTKNRIQSIIREITPIHTAFNASHVELVKKSGGYEKEDGSWTVKEKPEGYDAEYDELASVSHTLTCGFIDYNKIENVESEYIYNFELLKRFFENLPPDI